MPQDRPHQNTILHLIPVSLRARDALHIPENEPFVSLGTLASNDENYDCPTEHRLGLEVGQHVAANPCPGVLVELGRNADLNLPASSISKVHCSFEVHPQSGEIMFCDRSRLRNTTISPDGFRTDGDFRQIVIRPTTTYRIGMGGQKKDLFVFDIWWMNEWKTQIERLSLMTEAHVEHSQLARTSDEEPTDLGRFYSNRLHKPSGAGVQRVYDLERLGHGSYGTVYKAVDRDSGRLVAVKKIPLLREDGERDSNSENLVYREVKVLSSISHRNVVEYLGSSGWEEGTVQIYMPLRTGNLNGLFAQFPKKREDGLFLTPLMQQMLEALDHLAYKGLCHRDVKPENILYTEENNGNFLFQLADFGLANHRALAKTQVGTFLFVAPEIVNWRPPQTPKVDVWSLFVTFASIMYAANFDDCNLLHYNNILDAVRKVAVSKLRQLSPMAHENPEMRATAAQMLVKLFDGKGLSTPRRQIGRVIDLEDSGSAMVDIEMTDAPASPSPATQVPQKPDAGPQRTTKLEVRTGQAGVHRNANPGQPQQPRPAVQHDSKPPAYREQASLWSESDANSSGQMSF